MRRVLIIDGEEGLRTILPLFLTRHGYDVVVAENGEKGLKLFNKVPGFDLVITDIRMRDMDGNDVARFVRNSSKLACHPVLRTRGMLASAGGALDPTLGQRGPYPL